MIDNYQFIEAPLEKQNKTLSEEKELMLSEDLRALVVTWSPETGVQLLVKKRSNLIQADILLAEDPSIK